MTRFSGRAALVGAALAACASARATAQGTPGDSIRLSYADAQQRALASNPAFLAVRQNVAIAMGDVRQARTWRFNPQVEYESSALDAGRPGRYEAAISQEIEFAGQRGLRTDVARVGLRRTAEAVRDAARLVLWEVGDAYYTARAALERLAVAEEIRTADSRLLAALRAQLAEGEISLLESRLAEIELARNRARVLDAQREARSAHISLAVALGLPGDTPLSLAGELPRPVDAGGLDADSLVSVALQHRPDLNAAAVGLVENEAAVRLVRREALPTVSLRALAEREDAGMVSVIGVGVGLALPLWNRNQGLVARGDAAVRQARYAVAASSARVRGEVGIALQAYVSTSEQLAIYESEVLSPARGQQLLLETAYREGKFDLTAFLLVRQRLLDAELGYWDAWLAHRRALIALDAATAGSVVTADYLTINRSEQ